MSQDVIYADSQESFSRAILENKAVLVDFFADWCGPCQGLAPTLDAIADNRKDIKVVKVDVDDQPEIAAKYGVRGIPFMLFIKEGNVEATLNGLQPRAAIEEIIDNVLVK